VVSTNQVMQGELVKLLPTISNSIQCIQNVGLGVLQYSRTRTNVLQDYNCMGMASHS